MKKAILCLAFAGITAGAMAYTPGAPSQLELSAQSTVVTLKWNWESSTVQTSLENFESEQFPPAGWQMQSTTGYEDCMWMPYFFGEDEEFPLMHSGKGVALILTGFSDEASPLNHQDERLIVKPKEGSVYMDFWYYIHPQLLEDGGYSAFPDHYYVEVSYDNGEFWSELWDARWDMGSADEVRQASLFLDQPADENTLVRFRAVSGEEEGLYYLWAIDDVAFRAQSDALNAPSLTVVNGVRERIASAISTLPTHRKFTPAEGASRIERSKIVEEYLNDGHISWQVCRNGEPVFSYIKAFEYVDSEEKEAGEYTYTVMPWSEEEDYAYEAAESKITLTPPDYTLPANVKARAEKTEDGRYDIFVTWEDPQGELIPVSYKIMINGKYFGEMPYGSEYEMAQNVYPGIYWFDVIANYTMPQGASDPVRVYVAAGVKAAPVNLEAETEGRNVTLTWDKPTYGAETPDSYDVYRGDVLLASAQTATTYTDMNQPKGSYLYSIHAVYGTERSLPAEAKVEIGENYRAILPIEQSFNGGHLPANWNVYMEDKRNAVKDMYNWRFDNYFNNQWPWNSADFNYENASVSGKAAGANKLQAYLSSPAFVPSADSEVIFKKYYNDDEPGLLGPAQFIVRVKFCDDDLTEPLADLTTGSGLETVTLSLSEYEGAAIYVEWGFISFSSGFAMVDDVKITGTTGVENIVSESDCYLEVYNIQGIRVATGKDLRGATGNLPSGIYLVKDSRGVTRKIAK